MKENISPESLRVCTTIERDAKYIADGGDYKLLAGTSTALTKKTLQPCLTDSLNVVNTTSRNRHYDIT